MENFSSNSQVFTNTINEKNTFTFNFFPIFLCSQSKRDLKKYNNIVKLIEQNNLDLAISKTCNLLENNDEWKNLIYYYLELNLFREILMKVKCIF